MSLFDDIPTVAVTDDPYQHRIGQPTAEVTATRLTDAMEIDQEIHTLLTAADNESARGLLQSEWSHVAFNVLRAHAHFKKEGAIAAVEAFGDWLRPQLYPNDWSIAMMRWLEKRAAVERGNTVQA